MSIAELLPLSFLSMGKCLFEQLEYYEYHGYAQLIVSEAETLVPCNVLREEKNGHHPQNVKFIFS